MKWWQGLVFRSAEKWAEQNIGEEEEEEEDDQEEEVIEDTPEKKTRKRRGKVFQSNIVKESKMGWRQRQGWQQ